MYKRQEYNKYKVLILKDKAPVTLTDHQTIEYALETMQRTESQDRGYMTFLAGRPAFEKAAEYFESRNRNESQSLFDFYLDINAVQTKQCVMPYYLSLLKKYPACEDLRPIVNKLSASSERMNIARNQLFSEESIDVAKCVEVLLDGQLVWAECLDCLARLQALDKLV